MKVSALRFTLLAAVLVVLAIAAPAANAGILVATANDCPSQTLSQPFAKWDDTSSYFLAPGGSFESGSPAWALAGGAKVVSGNEPFKVHSSADTNSLYIPQGGSATSPTICVGLSEPSIRWFAKQQASLLGITGAMTVQVQFETSLGQVVSAPIAGAGLLNTSWNPSLPGVVEASLLPLLPGDQTPVRFQFTAVTGSWSVDDVYVDPYSRW
jgi:hypothetical protein